MPITRAPLSIRKAQRTPDGLADRPQRPRCLCWRQSWESHTRRRIQRVDVLASARYQPDRITRLAGIRTVRGGFIGDTVETALRPEGRRRKDGKRRRLGTAGRQRARGTSHGERQESDMADASLAQTISADTVKPHALARMKPAKPSTCCGGPPPTDADACCARDAEVKSTGGPGCGCGSVPATPAGRQTACPTRCDSTSSFTFSTLPNVCRSHAQRHECLTSRYWLVYTYR